MELFLGGVPDAPGIVCLRGTVNDHPSVFNGWRVRDMGTLSDSFRRFASRPCRRAAFQCNGYCACWAPDQQEWMFNRNSTQEHRRSHRTIPHGELFPGSGRDAGKRVDCAKQVIIAQAIRSRTGDKRKRRVLACPPPLVEGAGGGRREWRQGDILKTLRMSSVTARGYGMEVSMGNHSWGSCS